MSEVIFLVEDADEGGYIAEALGYSIVTQGDTLEELDKMVRDAVRCYFEDGENIPKTICLRFVRERVLAV